MSKQDLAQQLPMTCGDTRDPWFVTIIIVLYAYQVGLAWNNSTATTYTRRIIISMLFIPISAWNALITTARVILFAIITSRYINRNNARHVSVRPETTPRPEPATTLELTTLTPPPTGQEEYEHRPPTMWIENEVSPPLASRI